MGFGIDERFETKENVLKAFVENMND